MGYEGASLSRLSAAAGLQKASLYHRFPGGKAQMAEEVLSWVIGWFSDNILSELNSAAPPETRIARISARLEGFFDGGRKACLFNMLSSPRHEDGPFTPAIKAVSKSLIDGFAAVAEASGFDRDASLKRAARAAMLLQGSLVLSRGMNDDAPFLQFLDDLPAELLSPTQGEHP